MNFPAAIPQLDTETEMRILQRTVKGEKEYWNQQQDCWVPNQADATPLAKYAAKQEAIRLIGGKDGREIILIPAPVQMHQRRRVAEEVYA